MNINSVSHSAHRHVAIIELGSMSYGRSLPIHVIAGLFFAFLLLALSTKSLHAQSYFDLYDFAGTPGGCCPQHPSYMAEGRDGFLYGVTATGGANNKGMIFKIGPNGGETTLYNFDGTHGGTPVGGLTLGLDGNLYGMAETGGLHGEGNIFKITPAGSYSVVYSFTAGSDGGLPVSPLIVGTDGNFYGTSYPGAAFKLTPGGTFSVITKIPISSYGPLLQTPDGSFYGVTEFGGKNSAGTVYKIMGSTSTILHSFDAATGAFPIGGLVQGADGNLYGTTTAGGTSNAGVIYRITSAGTYTVLVEFDNVHTLDGYQAYAGLIAGADGYMYGATIWGGQYGYGVIFRLSTSGDYSVLYDFSAPGGDGAYATPMQHTNGSIYGLTNRGGAGFKGVIYSLADGLAPFIRSINSAGHVGGTVGILGQGFSTASSVEFNGTPASFHVISDTYLTATVPSGETGLITVNTSGGILNTGVAFHVPPTLTHLSPTKGKVGSTVTLTGTGLIQTASITLDGKAITSYTVHSDTSVTFKVPTGAKTGKIVVTTPGGKATSSGSFTVTK